MIRPITPDSVKTGKASIEMLYRAAALSASKNETGEEAMTSRYPDYESLKLDWPAPRVLRVTMSNGKVNAMSFNLHHDIAQIWRIIDTDPEVSAVILTGEGRAFSAGGDL